MEIRNKKLSVSNTFLKKSIEKKTEHVSLIIKPNIKFNGEALAFMRSKVSKKTRAKVIKMNKTKDGSIIIKCNSDKVSEEISKSIDENDPLCIKKKEKNLV